MHGTKPIGQVLSCSPSVIVAEVRDVRIFEDNKERLQIGRYLKIAQGNNAFCVAIIVNLRGVNAMATKEGEEHLQWTFHIECQPIGAIDADDSFERGSVLLPVPTEPVFLADDTLLHKLFQASEEFSLPLGSLSMNPAVDLHINGDRFFGKHIGIAGSTGAGKSCTVASVLQQIVGVSEKKNIHIESQKNAHVVIFDMHSEYAAAFTLEDDQNFTLNVLDMDTLKLPYWLMNSEELESIFIESNEANSHNQVSQFKHAVILNKEMHNPGVKNVTYDTPVFFSIEEIYKYISNINREIIGKLEGEGCPKLSDGTLVKDRKEHYFQKLHDFVPSSAKKDEKASNGPFYGEFNRFCSRIETKLADKRLGFLLHPTAKNGDKLETKDFESIMKQFLGYLNRANVTIVDLSGIPFEVLSITVSLVARLIFDFCFHYSKLQHGKQLLNDVPVMLVCEEAHNYVPQKDNSAYRASRRSIERIAKEGRKYGLSLMVVSQRPSEVSETIYSQCNNFLALRLTNNNDQQYIRRLLPENSRAVTDALPNLADGECIVVGDAVLFSAIVQMEMPNPTPQSATVKIYSEWNKEWQDISFADVIKRWRQE